MKIGSYKYKDKPVGIYKTSSSEYNCSQCAYRINNSCNLLNLKLDVFSLTKNRCRDFLWEERGLKIEE